MSGDTIRRLMTYRWSAVPELLLLEVETDDGRKGLGETWGKASAIEGLVHDFFLPVLRRLRPRSVDRSRIWEALFGLAYIHGHAGAEMRALSAVDIALWDLVGQQTGLPICELLGGPVRDRIAAYNTVKDAGSVADETLADKDPARLARELIEEGWTGVKIYPFDRYAPVDGEGEDFGWLNRGMVGHHLAESDLKEGVEKVRALRAAAGDRLDIMIEGHYRWDVAAAVRIGRALAPLRITWMEDMTRSDNPVVLRRLVEETGVPILASERLMTRRSFLPVFERSACHFAMIDATFAGGISEARKIADIADAYDLPVTFHDSQGPVGAWANVHLAIACPNAHSVELVRSLARTWYAEVAENPPMPTAGYFPPPQSPGLGTCLSSAFLARADVSTRHSTV